MNFERFKDSEIGLIPEDWEVIPLKDLTNKIGSGSTPKGGSQVYVKKGVSFIRSQNIRDEGFNDDLVYINSEAAAKLKNVELMPNDVLLNITGDSICRTNIVPKIVLPGRVNQHVAIIRVNNKLYYKFLFYYLYSDATKWRLLSYDAGGTRKAITKGTLKSFPVPLPIYNEQKKIGDILSSLDQKIELNQKMNQTLESIGQAIFKHWFVDFEFPDENGNLYKSSGGEMVDSELGEIPQFWEPQDIYKICDVVYGAPFSSKFFNEDEEGIPLVRIRDLKKFKSGFFTNENHPKGTLIYPGDVVAGMDAEFTPYVWLGKISWMNQRICMFKPKYDYLHRFFIYNIVKIPLKFYENSKVGTTVIHLSKSDIDRFMVIVPPKEILEKFYSIIEPIFQRIVINAQENQNLSQIRDSLLPKLISGKIRVNIPEEASVK